MSEKDNSADNAPNSQGDTTQTFQIQPGERFLDLTEVMHKVNKGKTAVYKGIREGTFPRRYPNGWLQSDILRYIENEVRAEAELPALKYSHEIMAMQREQRI